MFYIISKILSFLLSPAVWMLLLIAWPLFTTKHQKRRKRLLWAISLAYILMNPFITDEVMRVWEEDMVTLPQEEYSGIIVLGGHMVTMDKEMERYIFRQHTDRIIQACLLFKAGKADKIILSGGSGHPLRQEEKESAYLAGFLEECGLPPGQVIWEARSRNTYENALETKQLMSDEGLSGKFILVTSAAHMRRARKCFEKQGIDVIPYPVDKLVGKRRYDPEHLFIPNVNSLDKWRIFTHEILGYLAYKTMGYA